jgi:hypothetical protein
MRRVVFPRKCRAILSGKQENSLRKSIKLYESKGKKESFSLVMPPFYLMKMGKYWKI